jgi:hypothetical protein
VNAPGFLLKERQLVNQEHDLDLEVEESEELDMQPMEIPCSGCSIGNCSCARTCGKPPKCA